MDDTDDTRRRKEEERKNEEGQTEYPFKKEQSVPSPVTPPVIPRDPRTNCNLRNSSFYLDLDRLIESF